MTTIKTARQVPTHLPSYNNFWHCLLMILRSNHPHAG
jgi:hypothetical protein